MDTEFTGRLDLQPTMRGDLLELRPLRQEDFEALYAVAADPLIWAQHPMHDRWQRDVFVRFFQDAMASGGAFAILDATTHAIIGSTRFHGYDPSAGEVEIGWTFLARAYWGGVYNRQLKQLMLRHAFGAVDRIVFHVGPQNMRSRRAMEKIGAREAGTHVAADGRVSVVYEIMASQFLASAFPPRPVYWLTTDRLALRRFTRDDLDWLVALYSDPDVMRYLGGPKARDLVEPLFEARMLRYYDEHPGLGIWVTSERTTGEPAGFHVLNHIQGETIVQVGFFLFTRVWGRGYATEMATALLRYGFRDLRLPRITGMTNLQNVASQGALAKSGLRRNGERAFSHPAYAQVGPMAWFEREAGEWLAERGRPTIGP